MTPRRREADQLRRGLNAWLQHNVDLGNTRVSTLTYPATGYSNETLVVHVRSGELEERYVLRLAPLTPLFPVYDLQMQASVLLALAGARIAAPRLVAFESDVQWLGAPFLLMSFVDGHVGGEIPVLDPWITDLSSARQAVLHRSFLSALTSVHVLDWQSCGVAERLRRPQSAAADVDGWAEYAAWAFDNTPPPGLAHALEWCRATAPADWPESLLWGDARLGNVIVNERQQIAALLDWELASIGPAEMDVSWYLALDDLTTHFVGRHVPGFLDRAGTIAHIQRRLGRPLLHLDWHETFALVRSAAISGRQARVAAAGEPSTGLNGDDNPVLRYVTDRITRAERSTGT